VQIFGYLSVSCILCVHLGRIRRVALLRAFVFEGGECTCLSLVHSLCPQQNDRAQTQTTSFIRSLSASSRGHPLEPTSSKTSIVCWARIAGNQAELVSHGLCISRYVGKPKRRLKHLCLSTALNLKRMIKLAEISAIPCARYLSYHRFER